MLFDPYLSRAVALKPEHVRETMANKIGATASSLNELERSSLAMFYLNPEFSKEHQTGKKISKGPVESRQAPAARKRYE